MGKKFRDSDILNAMITKLDEDAVVYGANGHYAIGAYQDLTKVSSVFGDKDYNSQDNIGKAENVQTVEQYKTNNGELNEYLQDANWLKDF